MWIKQININCYTDFPNIFHQTIIWQRLLADNFIRRRTWARIHLPTMLSVVAITKGLPFCLKMDPGLQCDIHAHSTSQNRFSTLAAVPFRPQQDTWHTIYGIRLLGQHLLILMDQTQAAVRYLFRPTSSEPQLDQLSIHLSIVPIPIFLCQINII